MPLAPMAFTTWGPARGTCGHRHQSTKAAKRCLDWDVYNESHEGRVSDRKVYEINADGRLFNYGQPVRHAGKEVTLDGN